MKAFARFKNKVWCVSFAFVDKLTEEKISVKLWSTYELAKTCLIEQ